MIDSLNNHTLSQISSIVIKFFTVEFFSVEAVTFTLDDSNAMRY